MRHSSMWIVTAVVACTPVAPDDGPSSDAGVGGAADAFGDRLGADAVDASNVDSTSDVGMDGDSSGCCPIFGKVAQFGDGGCLEVLTPVVEDPIGCSATACVASNAQAGCYYSDVDGGRIYYFTPDTWPIADMDVGVGRCSPTPCF